MNKKYSITILLLLVLAVVLNISSQDIKTEVFSGKLKSIGGEWYINTGEDFFLLTLAPEEFLAEKQIELKSKEKIEIHGSMGDEEIIVHKLILAEKEHIFRDTDGNPLWEDIAAKEYYKVNPKKCIGCRLCVNSCPTDAITMVKGRAVIDADKCIACGFCADGKDNYKGCPTSAIDKISE